MGEAAEGALLRHQGGWAAMDEEASEARFAAYVEALVSVIGHADRAGPMRDYCTGLLLSVERKSVEPMAAALAPERTAAKHQSLLHFVGQAAWSDEKVLEKTRALVLPAMTRAAPIRAWIIDDTSFPKKGKHSVGVAHQYCGQLGKQENCQVAVTLSVANDAASLPVAHRLYLPESWASDPERRKKAGVPSDVGFKTKPQIALDQITAALTAGVARGAVLADAAYGNDCGFRSGVTAQGLPYVMGISSTTSVWPPGAGPVEKKAWTGRGRPPSRLRRDEGHRPLCVKALAMSLPARAYKKVGWREGTNETLSSRFAAVRVRPARRDHERTEPHAIEWLLVEWPKGDKEPAKYWLSTSPETMPLKDLVNLAKLRWRIERDYQDLKQEIGLGHYEGRSWRGFHHHATLSIAAYGFLVSERETIPPSGPRGAQVFKAAPFSPGRRPRGAPDPDHPPRQGIAHDLANAPQRRARQATRPMSMLYTDDKPEQQKIAFVTQ
jgi:SRSO17 transposase